MSVAVSRHAAMRFVMCFGVVSLFADMTYEGARSIVGPFFQQLGASAFQVGFIAGLGEMLAASLRFFSGRFADRTRAYWTLAIVGYSLNLLVVPLLAFATNWQTAAVLLAMERTGKAVRGPARDVLLSGATNVIGHGWGFGVHAAFDQAGAMLGPLIVAILVARSNAFAPAFLFLAIPAALSLAAITLAYRANPVQGIAPKPIADEKLPRVFWTYVAGASLVACGFADFPLLAYHFQNKALIKPAVIPVLYAGAMGVVGLTALVFGRLFDRYGLRILAFGIVISAIGIPLGFLGGVAGAVAGVACWAVGLGAQDATLRSGIAQVVRMQKRGTAFGVFNGVYGVAWFLGSSVMGLLYDHSKVSLVVFGVVTQLLAAAVFGTLVLRLPGSYSDRRT